MHVPVAQYRNMLATYLMPQAHRVAILSLLLCANIVLLLINPQILRHYIDVVSMHGLYAQLASAAVLFIAAEFVRRILVVASTYLSEKVGWSATNALREDLTLHLLRLDLTFHKRHTPGELIERVDGDVTTLASFFSQFVIQIVSNVVLLLGILLVLLIENWIAGLILSIYAAIMLLAMVKLRSFAVKYWRTFRQANADLFGFLEERLIGTADIRSCGAQAYVLRRLYQVMRERVHAGRRARLMSVYAWSFPNVIYTLGISLAFLLAAYFFQSGSSMGTAFVLYYYTQFMLGPLNVISNQVDDFQKASAGIVRIAELFQTHSALPEGSIREFPAGPLAVEFCHVSFGYGEDEMVLNDLSFKLEPGSVLGLLGRTGSGKTTISRLLFRLYDPDAGNIRLGGIDLRDARKEVLRSQIGIVTQEVQLFHASLRDNITVFDRSIEDSRIMEALNGLGLMRWYASLPDGLNTMLAAGGGGLSAGEAQLLAFARVFLHDPGLIILDEASSRLDPATESLIETAVDKLMHNRTGIIIAHRLSTVQHADHILILDRGCISEYGSRIELAANPDSRFAQLLQLMHHRVAE